ncbi:hypothetical protein D9619_004940 [Psilocybe cf. subviscida]|uniref:Prokaryotic-type class I peptide chain release factors domain-containing protein n=1 Tax=Psilocybe cf. subviscida TaxID=2480587 RepID=A0A8H5BRL8_9AGAR|nr:hypothetical protein D9619_004940 [Psilocybe cf. subviscida]
MLSRILTATEAACIGTIRTQVLAHRSLQFHPLRSFASGANHPGISSLLAPTPLATLASADDHSVAAGWLDDFRTLGTNDKRIPRDVGELSFSRSSGPGGQNVNKVNTKATLRCNLAQAWIPKWAVPALKNEPHYVASTHSILVTSTVHRSQDQNIEECLKKLHAIICTTAASCIQRVPSAEQKKKVEGLVKAEKARRKAEKIARSSVKQERRGDRGDFDY